jgi:hypothetical protein
MFNPSQSQLFNNPSDIRRIKILNFLILRNEFFPLGPNVHFHQGKKQVLHPYTWTGRTLSNSMQQSPLEADGHSATQEISCPLWNLKV